MSNLLVIIHGGSCPDGFGAAWAVYKRHPNAEFKFAFHGQTPPDVVGRDVVIADFCYPRDQLIKMKAEAKSLIVLDHHKTAQAECGDLEYCHFNMNKSGAVLAWEYFHPDTKIPWLLQYIQYRDLGFIFRNKEHPLPYVETVLAAIDSYPKTFYEWNLFAGMNPDPNGNDSNHYFMELEKEGAAILRYQAQLIDQLMKRAHDLEIGGLKVKAINSPILQSELGNLLARQNGIGVVWNQGIDTLKFSLRSTETGPDVEAIASSFPGGGGHRNASGFSVSPIALEEHLKDKK